MRGNNLALDRLLSLAQLLVDRRKCVPRDADNGVDADDFAEKLDCLLQASLSVSGIRLAEKALDFGRRFDIACGAAAGLSRGSGQRLLSRRESRSLRSCPCASCDDL